MKWNGDKRIWAAGIGGLLGMGLGAGLMYRAIGPFYQNALAESHVSSIMYDTQTAMRLREKKSEEVARRLEASMEQNVTVLYQMYPQHPMSAKALRNIKFFYVRNNLPIPSSIQPVLAPISLPAPKS